MQTKNSCKLVNELKTDTSGKIEELEAEIDNLASEVDTKASIEDSETALDSTWSSAKIREEIDAGSGDEGFQLTYLNAPTLSKIVNTATYTHSNYQLDTPFTAFNIPSFRVTSNNHVLLAFVIQTNVVNNGIRSIDIEIQLTPNNANRLTFTVSKDSDSFMFPIPLYSFGIVNDSATLSGTVKYTVHSDNETGADFKTAFTLYNLG